MSMSWQILVMVYFLKNIGGIIGDRLGAGNEIAEVASMLLIVMMERWVL